MRYFILVFFLLSTVFSEETRLAFGSCLLQKEPMPILNAVENSGASSFLILGDAVYGSFDHRRTWSLKRAYQRQKANFKALNLKIPMDFIWDDGDYGTNDGDGTFSYKKESEKLFLEAWEIPEEDERRTRPGLYFSKIIQTGKGLIQILILDVRYFRDPFKRDPNPDETHRYLPDYDSSKTMLGKSQWKWLEEQLQKKADVRLIVSPLQVLARGHFWECWAMFPKERLRLLALLDLYNIKNAALITGDRHRGAFYKEGTPFGTPIVEMTTSALNRPATERDEPGPTRLMPLYVNENFGLVRVLWDEGLVLMELRDLQGELIAGHIAFQFHPVYDH